MSPLWANLIQGDRGDLVNYAIQAPVSKPVPIQKLPSWGALGIYPIVKCVESSNQTSRFND